ncbi:MAG: dienelactone hydrolase family protein [Phycisphaerales bacterium]|nr:MAG: dienelactone hydrolase family protein [Phycisphaerales bacterium]
MVKIPRCPFLLPSFSEWRHDLGGPPVNHVHAITLFLLVCSICATIVAADDDDAAIETRTITYEHGEMVLEGYFAAPADREADSTRPGILVVHEWWGHNDFARRKAERLARLGYAAFALDMYGRGITADRAPEASRLAEPFYQNDFQLMRSRARAGLDVLAEQPEVDADRLASIGFCFGGTVSLQLAYDGAPVRGVVSFHGSLPPPLESDSKPEARILILHGAEDPLVPDEQVRACTERLSELEADWQLIAYGGAVHSFTNPAADGHGIDGVAYDETAHRRSWRHMQIFFEELFD